MRGVSEGWNHSNCSLSFLHPWSRQLFLGMKLLISQDALPGEGCAVSVGHTLGSLPFCLSYPFHFQWRQKPRCSVSWETGSPTGRTVCSFSSWVPQKTPAKILFKLAYGSQSLVSSIILWSSFFWNSSPNLLLHRIPHKNPDLVQYNLRCWFPVPCLHCKMPGCLTVKNLFLFGYLFFSKMEISTDFKIFIRKYIYKYKNKTKF